jgi:ComF family protein
MPTLIQQWLSECSETRRRWWRALVSFVDATCFPIHCTLCGTAAGPLPFCAECREKITAGPPLCERCALPVGPYLRTDRGCSECRGRSLGFHRAVALGPYAGSLRELCLRLKHQPNSWLSHWLGLLLLHRRWDAISTIVDLEVDEVPVVTSVPSHWLRRIKRRHHDQAEELGRAVAAILGLRYRPLLRRVKSTRRLAELSRTERKKELDRAFRARGRGMARRHVLLVDDILTTGATCGAAARVLKKAGAKRVTVLVIARAEGRV